MPELYSPASDGDQDNLLFGTTVRRCFPITRRHMKIGIISAVVLLVVIIGITTTALLHSKTVVPINDVTTTIATTTTTTGTTTPKPTTTTIPSTTTTTATTTTTTTTTTMPTTTTTTPKTTTPKTTTTLTTTALTPKTTPATTTITTTTSPANHTTSFPPPLPRDLPENATDWDPVALLNYMEYPVHNITYTDIPCIAHSTPVFKYNVTVDEYTFASPGGNNRKIAKKGVSMVANEALFLIHYNYPVPTPKYPCN